MPKKKKPTGILRHTSRWHYRTVWPAFAELSELLDVEVQALYLLRVDGGELEIGDELTMAIGDRELKMAPAKVGGVDVHLAAFADEAQVTYMVLTAEPLEVGSGVTYELV